MTVAAILDVEDPLRLLWLSRPILDVQDPLLRLRASLGAALLLRRRRGVLVHGKMWGGRIAPGVTVETGSLSM